VALPAAPGRRRTGRSCASSSIAAAWRSRRQAWRQPIPTNDLWIAASCVECGAVLFSLDAHFDQVAGLRRITRWAEALP
jgi:predicted nucleic acid-binding protein